MYASALSNTSTEDSVSHDERLPSFQKEQPNPNPVSENEQVCASMLLFLKQDCDNEDFNMGSKEPEFTNKKTIKKPTKIKIRHKRCSTACCEHKRKHQRCPPECFRKQLHQQLVQQQLNHLQNQFEFPDHQSVHSNHSNQTTPPSSPVPAEQCVAIPIMAPTSLYQVPTVGNLLFFYPICDQQLPLPNTNCIPQAVAPKGSDELGSMISRFMTFPQGPQTLN